MVQARDVKPGLRSRGVKSLFDGFDGLFVKQACLKSGFKDSGFTGGFGFQVVDYGNRFGTSSAPRSWFGFGVEARDASSSPCRFSFDVEVGLQETYPFKVGVRGSCAVVATFLGFVQGTTRHLAVLVRQSGSLASGVHSVVYLDHNQAAVATKTESGSQDQDDDQDRSKESSRGHYVDHDGSRSQAAVSTSTTTDQGIEAAVSTSTATNQGDQYGSESSYQGQDDDQDKSGHQDQDGSSSGVGVRDASSSPHAFGAELCRGSCGS
ncbi:hypothetical protein B0F90DRAFT_1826611 [Multifurca ochricompacta]|uniref:Uncharacterized protein n=1 Tax=Multifurca ochricompacta TaxID=376703 RepID=A0AAD4QDW2_9AGAM|nr:hypothetical protein B0F90DRAFT_1826611 [Multifurca ochricompacta]